jgi:hypothetical protein
MESCQICEKRRPRRYCPGVRGDICSQCCGAEREVTVDCPLDCEYLLVARQHEKTPELSLDDFPNQDIRVTDQFIDEHGRLVVHISRTLAEAALQTPGAVDNDLKEALEASIKTYRTLESGLIYESRPANPYAASIQQFLQTGLQNYREQMRRATGLHTIRDADILGVLVFLERLQIQYNNGRRRGRAFLHFLLRSLPPEPQPSPLVG